MYIIFMSSDFVVAINFLHVGMGGGGCYDKKTSLKLSSKLLFSCHCLSLYISIPVYVQLLCDMIYVCMYVYACTYVIENNTRGQNWTTKTNNVCTCM